MPQDGCGVRSLYDCGNWSFPKLGGRRSHSLCPSCQHHGSEKVGDRSTTGVCSSIGCKLHSQNNAVTQPPQEAFHFIRRTSGSSRPDIKLRQAALGCGDEADLPLSEVLPRVTPRNYFSPRSLSSKSIGEKGEENSSRSGFSLGLSPWSIFG